MGDHSDSFRKPFLLSSCLGEQQLVQHWLSWNYPSVPSSVAGSQPVRGCSFKQLQMVPRLPWLHTARTKPCTAHWGTRRGFNLWENGLSTQRLPEEPAVLGSARGALIHTQEIHPQEIHAQISTHGISKQWRSRQAPSCCTPAGWGNESPPPLTSTEPGWLPVSPLPRSPWNTESRNIRESTEQTSAAIPCCSSSEALVSHARS